MSSVCLVKAGLAKVPAAKWGALGVHDLPLGWSVALHR